MSNQERVAEVMRRWAKGGGELNSAVGSPHEIATLLADTGLLMEDLPKPDSKGRWATELFGGGVFAVREPGVVDLVRKDGVISNRAEVLRREALRMLAAAKHAEEQK